MIKKVIFGFLKCFKYLPKPGIRREPPPNPGKRPNPGIRREPPPGDSRINR